MSIVVFIIMLMLSKLIRSILTHCNFAVKLGVGGFSMGAATALYSATCRVLGHYGNGNLYPVNLNAVVGLSGWLPCARYGF